jgi:urea transport system permease protein
MTEKLRPYLYLGGWVISAVLLLVVVPFTTGDVMRSQFAQYCCLATVAVGIGLAWGRGGMLVLGQGLFFGLGAYMMAMHIQLADVPKGTAPAYLQNVGVFDDHSLPTFWQPFHSDAATILLIIVVPGVLAYAIGLAVFKRRVKGAFFAILSQALLYAFALYIKSNQLQIGGVTGLTGLKNFFGLNLSSDSDQEVLYYVAAIVLLLAVALMAWLYRSRFGELLVAIRDAEERVRFLGYDPANVKLAAFVIAAVLAAFAGALYAPINQHIGTGDFDVVPSIMMVIGVAVGGRTTLFGPPLGAILIGYSQYKLSSEFPTFWQYLIGALFIIVVAVLPGGIVDLPKLALRGKHLVDDIRVRRRPAQAAGVPS